MAQKPSIPKGTRDFTPSEVIKRNYIFDIVKKHFQTFGYQPIETPSFENSDTLLGKYGDEGDRLIFKILESGEYLEKAKSKAVFLDDKGSTYLNDLLGKVFRKIRNDLKIECSENFSGDEKYANMHTISKYLKDNIWSILNQSPEIAYIGHIENLIGFYFRDSSVNTAIKIVNRSSFFKDDIAFQNFQLVEQREIFDDLLDSLEQHFLLNTSSPQLTSLISEKALRYDLTVPFARYVVMHQNELDFPFKRYQIQPVWRADRPQKGRFREFFQCDADVVGSDSLLQEVELIQLYDAVFTDLKLEGVTIKLNNRKILGGIAEVIGAKHLLIDFTVALDKLDKIGEEGVKKEMLSKGISESAIEKAAPLFSLNGSNTDQLMTLENMLKTSEEGSKGVSELRFILETISTLGLQSAKLTIDVTLARGLNYYTGAIFEVAAPDGVDMGSVGGGGRYDDLTGIFGLKDVSGVGISFGLDRIYLVLEELNLFPKAIDKSLDVLCLNFGTKEGLAALKLTTVLRKAGIKADLYPSDTKIQKQFKYANNRQVPYVILLGEEELKNHSFVVKNMSSGDQKTYGLDAVQDFIASL